MPELQGIFQAIYDEETHALRVTAESLGEHDHDDSYVLVVNHGATAGTARPAAAAAVYWIGSVEPTNAEDHDLWYDTTA